MTSGLGKILEEALNPIADSIWGYALIFDKNGKCIKKADNTGYLQDQILLDEIVSIVSRCRRPMVKRLNYFMGITTCIIPINDYYLVTGTEYSKFYNYKSFKNNNTKYSFSDIIGESRSIKKCKEEAILAAENDCSTLIWGETGTGKELFAQAIHNASPRQKGPFVAVNCSSFPSSLVESHLFGYVGGAFTGAKREGSEGIFEQAHGGTLFLDEISEMNIDIQAKLLRVIQEREVVRVGGKRVIPVDVRIIASSNKNLNKMVMEKSFRQDLFFRLYVFDIYLPPLRERKEDIPLLIQSFLEKNYPRENIKFDRNCVNRMMKYYWPGNIRELYNCLDRSIRVARRQTIQVSHLPPHIREWEDCKTMYNSQIEIDVGNGLVNTVQLTEKYVIERALSEANYNRTKAARKLGISNSTLWRKIKEYKIDITQVRSGGL